MKTALANYGLYMAVTLVALFVRAGWDNRPSISFGYGTFGGDVWIRTKFWSAGIFGGVFLFILVDFRVQISQFVVHIAELAGIFGFSLGLVLLMLIMVLSLSAVCALFLPIGAVVGDVMDLE